MVSAYRPCKSTEGATTVWSQHRNYFDRQDPPRNEDPVEAFVPDMIQDLKRFYSKGSQIVLCMDTNFQKLKIEGNSLEVLLQQLCLKDIILNNHDRQTFIDVKKVDAFGQDSLQTFVPPSVGELVTTDPRVVTKYNNHL